MIAIKGMEMPKSCSECSFKASDYVCGLLDCVFSCNHFKERNYNCPLVEIEEHKVGKWIEIKNKNGTTIALRCDYCEKSPKHAIRSLYCPNCGTKMESVENE